MTDPFANYDAWLEAPYVQRARDEEEQERAFEAYHAECDERGVTPTDEGFAEWLDEYMADAEAAAEDSAIAAYEDRMADYDDGRDEW